MEELLSSITQSLESGNFYSALFLAITMPSICSALESKNGVDSPEKYINWYKKYITETSLSGSDCYAFRCSLLHQGKGNFRGDAVQPTTRILFTFLGAELINVHVNEAVILEGFPFCESIIDAVREWIKDVKDDEYFRKNSEKLITLHPRGLPHYVVGTPVVG